MRLIILIPVRLLGEGLEAWLRRDERVQILGVVQDFAALRALLAAGAAQVVLVDVTRGVDADEVRAIAAERPEVRLVALGLAEQRAEVVRCAKAGFAAYIPRDTPLDELGQLLRDAAQGRSRCPAEIVAGLMRALFRPDLDPAARPLPHPPLTRREGEILGLIGRGLSNKGIARELALSAATVKNHVHNVLGKLGLPRRNEAMRRVRDEPWLATPARVSGLVSEESTTNRGVVR